MLQRKAALLWTVGRHKASLSRFTPRSSRGERGICPFAGKTHCLLCCPYSSLSVVKPKQNSLQGCSITHSLCPSAQRSAVPEFRLQHWHICHMVLRLPCLFYLYLKDNEPNAFLMSLVSISSLILIALGMATGSNCTGHGDGGSGQRHGSFLFLEGKEGRL